MTICSDRFRLGDDTDWILSTSASCLDGSTTANQILQELFKRQCNSAGDKNMRKRQKPARKEIEKWDGEENENLIVKKITGRYGFENFDESQHLNGCPMKWLYNKKLMEKNKRYRIGRICYKKLNKEVKREKSQNLRDKTPVEVKIHKINLTEKYTTHDDYAALKKPENQVEETHRRKLAAKLNWKLHDDSPEDTLPTAQLKTNYLPPRPMLGLKPLLSILLAPNQTTNCCSLTELTKNSPKREKITSSLSIQSLDLPDFHPPNIPGRMSSSRWGSKSSKLSKKLQVPNQITINLDRHQREVSQPESKIAATTPTIKKLNDKPKQTKSLTALFYELKDKSNLRNERFESMMKDLSVESQFKMKRFLNMSSESLNVGVIIIPRVQRKQTSAEGLNLVCGKIRFEKRPSSQKPKLSGREM